MASNSGTAPSSLAICIPTCDRAETLRATLRHLSQIQGLFDEIIISDDASTDHTAAVVEEFRAAFGRVRYLKQKAAIGPLRNANAVFSLTRCRYQYLLADDGRLSAEGISTGISQLEADPDAVAVYGGPAFLDTTRSMAAPLRFKSADGLALVQLFHTLQHPILRSSTYQRHCYYDDKSSSDWRLVQQLLKAGPIWLVPDPFRSGQGAGVADPALLTADYHDHRRSDWELYFSELGITLETADLASSLIFERLTSILDQARGAAFDLQKPLLERDFILRRRAHGQRSIEIERDWEKRALIAASLERAIEQLVATKSSHIVIENGAMNLPGLVPLLEAALPAASFDAVDRAEMVERAVPPRTALICQDWSVFGERAASGHLDDGVCRLAWADLITALRLTSDTGGRLLKGPDGTTHLATL